MTYSFRRKTAIATPPRSSSAPAALLAANPEARHSPASSPLLDSTNLLGRTMLTDSSTLPERLSPTDTHTPFNSPTTSTCTYCTWLDTWPETSVSSRPTSPSEISVSSTFSVTSHLRRSIPQHDDTRRHGLVLDHSSLDFDYSGDFDASCPDFEDLSAWRGPPPPYEEEEVPMHPLVYLQPRSGDMYGRKRSRCSSLTVQMANLVRVDSVVSATEAVVKGVGDVGRKALDLPGAVKGAKKALEAKRAKKKIAWLGKRQYL